MGVSVTGFDALLKSIEESPDKLKRQTILKARKLAEDVAGKARRGAPVKDGRLRNSLKAFVEVDGDKITGGVRTDYAPAIYHELGTGPVGKASNYPGQTEMQEPPKYRVNGWWYYSEEMKGQPLPDTIKFGKHKGEPRDPPGQISDGLVYTEGVPAKAYMYNALVATEDEIMAGLGECITEVFLEK